LVLNKIDRLTPEDYLGRRDDILARLDWTLPVYGVSAMTGEGTSALMGDLMSRLEALAADREAREHSSVDGDADDGLVEPEWHPLG
jgi:GTP-binding protein